jgi:uncharacterized protein
MSGATRSRPAEMPAPAAAGASRNVSALRATAQEGNTAALESLLLPGLPVNARDAQGRTALVEAVRHAQVTAVEKLLAHGADPNLADAQGVTPLALAQASAEPDIEALLRRYGAR